LANANNFLTKFICVYLRHLRIRHVVVVKILSGSSVIFVA